MIINPSAHTIIPRTTTFTARQRRQRRQAFNFSFCTKRFCFAVTKILCGFGVVVLLFSLWLGSSIDKVDSQINKIEIHHEQLVTANILLRAKKAHFFSSETVGVLAGDQFAIHLPESGQYKQL